MTWHDVHPIDPAARAADYPPGGEVRRAADRFDDVYALLLDVKAAVALTKGHGDQLLDHEKRIRAVERNVWIIVGIGVVAQILVPLIWTQLLP